MIEFKQAPFPLSFSKNPIVFKIFANNYSAEVDVYPKLSILFQYKVVVNRFIEFKFINPDSGETEVVNFIGTDGVPANGTNIPASPSLGTAVNQQYIEDVAEYMRKNSLIASYYNVVVNQSTLEIVAKQGVQDLIPFGFYNNINFTPPLAIAGGVSPYFWKASKRKGHRITINVYFEAEYMSNEFKLVSQQNDTVDSQGFQTIDISSIIDSEIKNSFETPPLPELTGIQKANVLRRYYIEVAEQWNAMQSDTVFVKSDILYAHFGGFSMEDWSRGNPVDYISSEKMTLTWWNGIKNLYKEQNDWIHILIDEELKDQQLEFYFKTLFTDGSDSDVLIQSETFNIYETVTIPCGFNQLNLGIFQDLWGWVIEVRDTQGNVLRSRKFLLIDEINFKTRTLVYLNSFGLAESFVTQGFWEQNIMISKEIASRTLAHDYKAINGRDFVFTSNSKNSFRARSGVLSAREAKSLETVLNVAPVFLEENGLLKPIIIDAATIKVNDESEIVQTLDLKITKSIERTNISEVKTLPTIQVTNNCGVFTAEIHSEKTITYFGDMECKLNGNSIEVTSPLNNRYTFNNYSNDEGVYVFNVTVEVEGESVDLTASFDFKREKGTFKYAQRKNAADVITVTIESEALEFVSLSDQDDNPENVIITPNQITSIIKSINRGVDTFQIEALCLSRIKYFHTMNDDFEYFHISKMKNLEQLMLFNCGLSNHFSTAEFQKLQQIDLYNSNVDSFELGMNLDLTMLSLDDNNMNAQAIATLINEIYKYRKLFTKQYSNNIQISLVGNPGAASLLQDTIDKITGAGLYSGDGLVQNNIVTFY